MTTGELHTNMTDTFNKQTDKVKDSPLECALLGHIREYYTKDIYPNELEEDDFREGAD